MNTPRDARRSGGMNTVLPSTMALIPFTNRRDNAKASGAPLVTSFSFAERMVVSFVVGLLPRLERELEYVIGWINVRPGLRDRFLEAAAEFTTATRSAPGVIFFELHRDSERPDGVLTLECFRDNESHAAHVQSQRFHDFAKVLIRFAIDARFENIVAGEQWLDEESFDD